MLKAKGLAQGDVDGVANHCYGKGLSDQGGEQGEVGHAWGHQAEREETETEHCWLTDDSTESVVIAKSDAKMLLAIG